MSEDKFPCPNCGTENRPEASFCRACGEPLGGEQPQLVGASALTSEIAAITDPLLQIGAGSSVALIGATLGRVLSEAGPRQAEVLRRCAIPRWFDTGVLAVLREKDDGNDRVIDLLRGYSFVRQLDGERYSYQDEVRDALLKEWQEQRPDDLHTLNERLASYFGDRAAQTAPAPRTLPKNLPQTTISFAPTGEWELCAREALYHSLLADQQAGMAELREAFTRAELGHRLGDAEALLQVTRNVSLDPAHQLWVRYLRARLHRAALQLGPAEAQLTAILDDPALDPQLEARARLTLGEVFAETGRWVRATELYRKSLEYFDAAGSRPEATEVMLLLSEAYQAIGINSGGWFVPAFSGNLFWQAIDRTWNWLLSLPFYLIAWFMRRSPLGFPHPRFLSSYHNWLLVWMYRTAQAWGDRARQEFEQLGDDAGMLRADQQLVEIVLLFGHPQDALDRLDALKARPAAQDPYRRAWLDTGRAAALVALGRASQAEPLLAEALARFREVGDVRREAVALALQGRLHAGAGAVEQALNVYTQSLERFRSLGYTAAREAVLYDLRGWQRRVGPGPISRQIALLLAHEPEKRYVARFPQSQLPLLRVLSVVSIPLALLLLALIVPRGEVRQIADLVSLQTVYDPWRVVGVLAVLLLLYSAAYTLVALVVIFFVPLGALEREQPDYLVTDGLGIARYDFRGALAQQLRWTEVRRWIQVDRCLWKQPALLFSSTFLEAADGHDLLIEGITGWYSQLQEDIHYHLDLANNHTRNEEFGFTVFRSASGALLAVGVALLGLFVFVENTMLNAVVAVLSPALYAAASLLAFSGLLILFPLAHWLAIRPLRLHRELDLRNPLPFLLGLGGLAMIVVGVLQLTTEVPAANFGLMIVGAYVLGNAFGTLVARNSRAVSQAIVGVVLLIVLGYVSWQTLPVYNKVVSELAADRALLVESTGEDRVANAAVAIEAARQVIDDPASTNEQRAQAWVNMGRAYDAVGDYQRALAAYNQALGLYGEPESDQERQAVATIYYNRAQALESGDAPWQQDLQRACALYPGVSDQCAAQQ